MIEGLYVGKKQNRANYSNFALVVGIVGLSVGFAAFSNTIKIQSRATVKSVSSTLNVDFSSSQTEVLTYDIALVSTPNSSLLLMELLITLLIQQ